MNRKQIFLIAGGVLVVIILIIGVKWIFQPASKSVQNKDAEFMFGASALVNEFITDEQMANSLYLDKVIQVTGTVNNIVDDGSIIVVSLKDPESTSGVLCSFDKSSVLSSADKLTMGSTITVKGVCTGFLLDVVLTKCSIVE